MARAFRRFFSKSEVNLRDSVEEDTRGRTFSFFARKSKKKRSSPGAEQDGAVASSRGEPNTHQAAVRGDDLQDSELKHGTAPRSKGSLSYSETDLRKKKFHTLSFSWKKKKKQHPACATKELTKPEPPGLEVEEWQKEQEEEIRGAKPDESPKGVQCDLSQPSELPLPTMGCWRGSVFPEASSQAPDYISKQHCSSEEHQSHTIHLTSMVPPSHDPASLDQESSDVLSGSSDTCNPVTLPLDSDLFSAGPSSSGQFETKSARSSPSLPVKNSSTSAHICTRSLQPQADLADHTVSDRDSDLFTTDSALDETDPVSQPLGYPHLNRPLDNDRNSSGLSESPESQQRDVPTDPGLANHDTCFADVEPPFSESNSPSQLSSRGGSHDHQITSNASLSSWLQDDTLSSSQSKIIEKLLPNTTFTVFNSSPPTLPPLTAQLCEVDVPRDDEPIDLRNHSSLSSSAQSLCSESHPSVSEPTVPYVSVYHGHTVQSMNQGMGAITKDQAVDSTMECGLAEARMEDHNVENNMEDTKVEVWMEAQGIGEKNDDQNAEAKMGNQVDNMKEHQGTKEIKMSGGQGAEGWTANALSEVQQNDGMTITNFSESDQVASLSATSEVKKVQAAAIGLLLPQEVTKEEQKTKVIPFSKSEDNGVKWSVDMKPKGGQQEGEKMQVEEQQRERGTKDQVENVGWEEIQGTLVVSQYGGKLKDNKEKKLEHPRGPEQEPEPPVPQVCMSEECWAASPTLEIEGVELNEGARPSEKMSTSSQLETENQFQSEETTHRKELWSEEPENTEPGKREFKQTDTVSLKEEPGAENQDRTAVGEETPPVIRSPGQVERAPSPSRAENATNSAKRSPGGLSLPSADLEEAASPGSDTVLEHDAGMTSGIGAFSTTLTVQPNLGTKASENQKPRFHKVSLVTAGEPVAVDVHGAGAKDATATSQTGLGRWQVQLVEETFNYEEGNAVSLFSSHSSPLPLSSHFGSDAVHPPSPSALQESTYFTQSMDHPRSPGSSAWLSKGNEVHRDLERMPSGRNWAELPAPAGERDSEWRINTGRDSQLSEDSSVSLAQEEDPHFGIFKATFVELLPSPTFSDPDSPHDMETLVDTLKSLDSPLKHKIHRHNSSSNSNFKSLPPIVEDAPSPDPRSSEPDGLNGSLPVDLRLSSSLPKEHLTPLEMLKWKQEQENPQPRSRSLSLPLYSSMERNPDAVSPDAGPLTLPNGPQAHSLSRLEGSLLFSNYRLDRPVQNGQTPTKNPLLRTSSLPESTTTQERLDPSQTASRMERFSFLTSPSGSLPGVPEPGRMSAPLPPAPGILEEVARLPSTPSDSLVLHRSLSTNGAFGTPSQNDPRHRPPPIVAPQPERGAVLKYRAFPDAYLTKEKEHGKLNPRPGKLYIYDQPGLTGQRIEVNGDITDGTSWVLPATIFIRVVRGGWVLYEKPDFKGDKIPLDEGDVELTYPFGPPEERPNRGLQKGVENGEEGEQLETPPQKFVIGSLRRAVRDYSVPDISLFPEENAEGKKVIFRDTSEDARIFGFPIKANSIIINAGLWLVFYQPFFQGNPRVLEVGGYPNPASWGVSEPYVGSLHPLKIGEPTVEFPNEAQLIIYEKPYFTGKSREIYTNMRDFITRVDQKQSAFMYSAGSIKVMGGCWVGYEKEGFRGHQYLLEEGEYHDWRTWGGCDSELRSVRLIQADLSEPMLVLFEMTKEEEAEKEAEKKTFEVTETIPDVELFGFPTMTSSIHVSSGMWIAYSHVDFSGNQYILEKGFYSSCADWGAKDNRICSLQPIRKALGEGMGFKHKVLLYSEPNFQGTSLSCDKNQPSLPVTFNIRSCRVMGGSWAAFEESEFLGNPYILSEGDYPNFTSMGCPPSCSLRSLKIIPLMFTIPSISLFGLEGFEGREVSLDAEVLCLTAEGFNNDFMSVRVNSGCWVLCEHSYHRGRQILLEPTEISNWHKYSELPTIGSLYPIRQKHCFFRIKNKERGHFLSIQGGMEEMKSGRVVVTEKVEGFSDLWFYQDGLIKNKLAPSMSLQVMGNVEVGSKVVLWSETRLPIQNWSINQSGTISSLTFSGFVLDMKGGKTYDRDHVIIWEKTDERPSQQWELEVL